jgi:hypothetical protein
MSAYLDNCGFHLNIFNQSIQFYGDTKFNENIIQNFPPSRIIGLLKAYK